MARECRGFTLVELLVVIGIIVLIIGFSLPMVIKAFKAGDRTRTAADLNTIAVALDAYKNDFGEYPHLPMTTGLTPNPVYGSGFAVLGKAIASPYGDGFLPTGSNTDPDDPPAHDAAKAYKPGDCVASGVSGSGADRVALVASTGASATDDAVFGQLDCNDGADGPGFRLRFDPVTATGRGKIYPAYLPPGKMKMQGLAILDHNNNPILYFPRSKVKVNINNVGPTNRGYYVSAPQANPQIVTGTTPPANSMMFNYNDNAFLARSLTSGADHLETLAKMQVMLGIRQNRADTGAANGWLEPGETPATTGEYILWSCGPDNLFGPVDTVIGMDSTLTDRAVRKCDDVIHLP